MRHRVLVPLDRVAERDQGVARLARARDRDHRIAGAVLGGLPAIDAAPVARSAPSKADRPAVAGSSVDGALLSVAAQSSAR